MDKTCGDTDSEVVLPVVQLQIGVVLVDDERYPILFIY